MKVNIMFHNCPGFKFFICHRFAFLWFEFYMFEQANEPWEITSLEFMSSIRQVKQHNTTCVCHLKSAQHTRELTWRDLLKCSCFARPALPIVCLAASWPGKGNTNACTHYYSMPLMAVFWWAADVVRYFVYLLYCVMIFRAGH